MYDYEEIIKLPYKIDDIYELLKKLLKCDKIKHMKLQNLDEENKAFDLIARRFRSKENINIKITEIKKGFIEIKVYSKSSFFERGGALGRNKKNVKLIVDLVLKELKSCNKSNIDDFSFEIEQNDSPIKRIIQFVRIGLLAVAILYIILLLIILISSFKEYGGLSVFSLLPWEEYHYFYWYLLFAFVIAGLCSIVINKGYKQRRTREINQLAYHLIKKNKNNAENDSNIINSNVINQPKSYLNKGVDYAKKVKTEKPIGFWTTAIIGSAFLIWALWSIFSGGISKIGKDPCDINYEATSLRVTSVDWCRTDRHGNATEKLPYGLDNNDFIWCNMWNNGTWIGDGPVYIECAKELGWDGTSE